MPVIRLTLINRAKAPLMIQIEPEGADFWLLADEEFELRADAKAEDGRFEVAHHPEYVAVYPSRDVGYVSVFQNGVELECGHNRPPDEKRA
jgi:hypothetical protein